MESVSETVASVVTGTQECARFADLNTEANWGQPNDVVAIVQNNSQPTAPPSVTLQGLPTTTAATATLPATLREFLRLSFYELGIEIEFSGKAAHEKGVIIDMDEDKLTELGLKPDSLRFGQTVVRVIL